ncbi:transmembrane protein fend-like isoform X2 [Hermetia illucens]|uniref:transmembrane protein fend-like isoform X2 n=1 Tax=Hermetia illucens TaxID=343691 RepID=UPI0018CC2379|nr:transmembrane protein fend-like isoform X2 [Hermetia illucens]
MVNSSVLFIVLATFCGFVRAQNVDMRELKACKRACYDQFFAETNGCRKDTLCRECYDGCNEKFGPFPVLIKSMERRENLVMTNITWDADITTKSKQCLVTWEVYGGGLMGNLLTDCCLVELSLWPDTRYNVHVTCKTKTNGKMRRSRDLFIDTTGATPVPTTSSTTTDNNFILEQTSKSETHHLTQKEETIVGTAISIMLFIAIAAIFVIYRSRRTPKTIEKEILIYKDLGIVSPTTLHV